uniref:Uncharacterized protein n=1 Tax=Oryza rufipogon TaxID=4529 RepID=A0A0E0R4C7_ORYRU
MKPNDHCLGTGRRAEAPRRRAGWRAAVAVAVGGGAPIEPPTSLRPRSGARATAHRNGQACLLSLLLVIKGKPQAAQKPDC